MGQKVHPRSVRLGVISTWDSNWFANKHDYARHLKEDYVIRKFLAKRFKFASLSKVEIDRKAQKLILRLITGRPGVVVGRGGQGLDQLRRDLTVLTGRKDIQLDVMEVARVDADAQLISESIAQQLEKRVSFRRAIKQSIQRAMRSGIKGIKIMVSGRLGGTDIARTEWSKEGRIPLHTFRADIEYGFSEALTMFGIIGVKVWVFKGEVMPGEVAQPNVKQRSSGPSGQGGPGGPGAGLAGGERRGGRGPGGPGAGGPGGRGRGRGEGGGGRGRGDGRGGRPGGGGDRQPRAQAPNNAPRPTN